MMNTILRSNMLKLASLLAMTLFLISVMNHYILTLNFFDNSGAYFSGDPQQESTVFAAMQRYIYLGAVLYMLVKLTLITLILYSALYIAESQVSFGKVCGVVISSEF